ncbi:integrase core domain-containing protein [Edwardsiella anguillarum]
MYCWPPLSADSDLFNKADYNQQRPHSSLNNLTPEEFIRSLQKRSGPLI